MEVFRSEKFYIFVRDETSLWWNRGTGAFSVKSAWDLSDIEDIECLGITDGIIGLVEHTNIYEPRLLVIKESVPVGQIYFYHTVYKVKSISILNLGMTNTELDLTPCTKHGSFDPAGNAGKPATKRIGARIFENNAFFNKTIGAVKNASNTIKTTTQQAATQVKHTVNKRRDDKISERFEKRLTDELHRLFEESDSFYYSRTLDLTNSLQRQYENEKILEAEESSRPLTDVQRWWRLVDDRFFWNKHMLKDVIALGSPECDAWILPIIQGFVRIETAVVDPADSERPNTESLLTNSSCDEVFTIGLISRRSRYRAGTRYNRRGIDSSGKVANYVETEQIVSIACSDSIHRASFIQVRGSVPIFWSQPDYKFRPPPRIDKGEEETQAAFNQHFDDEISRYGPVCIVNLIEQQGRERIIWEHFGDRVLDYNSPSLIYATFDFHEYCRGMHYENVSILINALTDIIADMKFCWRDDRGLICNQTGVFRVNCIDCLDRTNVVQTAIAKWVLEMQLCRLGLGAPGAGLPPALRHAFLTMWADNGDTISRQYAGTKALKGDYTRTGERKFTGIMKDGVASANRYYLSTFKDALRQVAVDVMTGESQAIPVQLQDAGGVQVKNCEMETETQAMAQHVKSLIDDCKKMLVPAGEPVLGSWGLIDADPNTGDPLETEMDSVLLLTGEAYYVADYDDAADRFVSVRHVPLSTITSVELGTVETQGIWSVGRKTGASEPVCCVRINYTVQGEAGYFHMFRSTGLRFFNNMAVVIHTKEEMAESLHSICESIMVARDVGRLAPIPFLDGVKLEKKKSKIHPSVSSGRRGPLYLDLSKLPTLTRNVSETQLVADIRSAGSKALTNMSEQFSKLNKLSHTLNARARPSLQLRLDQGATRTKKIFTLGQNRANESMRASKKKGSLSDGLSSDYSSDDENRTNIFEPTLDNFENNQHYIGNQTQPKPDMHEDLPPDCDLIENPLYSSKIEQPQNDESLFLSSAGIVMGYEPNFSQASKTPITSVKKNPFDSISNLNLETPNNHAKTPEIQVDKAITEGVSSLKLAQKLSHSSCEVNYDASDIPGMNFHVRSNSQHEITLNIAQSHSESALKKLIDVASPVSSATRDMVLSPFSKIAKGMQNLGANLDPRKIKGTPASIKQITEQQYEDHRKMQEKWRDCNTRLIAL